eukprot:6036299-Prymnesium_polylepis.2
MEYRGDGHMNQDDFGAARIRCDGSTGGYHGTERQRLRAPPPFALEHAGRRCSNAGSAEPPAARQAARAGPGRQGCHVASSAILGAGSELHWGGADPAAIERAHAGAAAAAENRQLGQNIQHCGRRSQL